MPRDVVGPLPGDTVVPARAAGSVAEGVSLSEATSALELVRRIHEWQPRSLHDLLTLPELPMPILRGLALPGTVAVAPGEGGVGKSTLFMRKAMSVATGTDFLGFDCELPGATVHLLAEDDQARADYTLCRLLLAETEQMRRETWSQSAIDDYVEDVRRRVQLISVRGVGATLAASEFGAFRVSASVDALTKQLSAIPDLRVVVIDTLSRFAGVPLDSNDSAPVVLTALERIAERTGAFVVALHHTGKVAAREKNEDQYSARGASAITDNARLVLRLRPLDDEEIREAGLPAGDEQHPRDYLRLTVPKSNYFPRPDPITICRAGFLFRIASANGQDVGALYRGHLQAVSGAIDELKRQQLKSSRKALEAVPALGGRNHARRLVDTCLSQGWAERSGNGPAQEIILTSRGREVLMVAGEVSARCIG